MKESLKPWNEAKGRGFVYLKNWMYKKFYRLISTAPSLSKLKSTSDASQVYQYCVANAVLHGVDIHSDSFYPFFIAELSLNKDLQDFENGCLESEKIQQKDVTLMTKMANDLIKENRQVDVALALLLVGIKHGNMKAMYTFANIILCPSKLDLKVEANVSLAGKLFSLASTESLPEASYNLALMYLEGFNSFKDKTPNYLKASELLEKSAKLGIIQANLHLSNLLVRGLIGNKSAEDFEKALNYLMIASEKGDPKSKYQLGLYYARGIKCNDYELVKDPKMAYQYWHEAAIPLNPDDPLNDDFTTSLAQFNLGNCYFLGFGLGEIKSPHYKLALEFWELAVETDSSNLLAWLHLGNIYMSGIGNPKLEGISPDIEKSIYYYEQLLSEATENGLWPIQMNSDDRLLEPHEKVCIIADSLLNQCLSKINLSKPTEIRKIESLQKKIPKSEAKINKDILSVFQFVKDTENPDDGSEKEHSSLNDQVNVIYQDAFRNRWSFVEDFENDKTQEKTNEPEKKSESCSIM